MLEVGRPHLGSCHNTQDRPAFSAGQRRPACRGRRAGVRWYGAALCPTILRGRIVHLEASSPTQHITGKLLWTLKVEASWNLKHRKERLILALTDKSTLTGSMGRDLGDNPSPCYSWGNSAPESTRYLPELGRRVKTHFSWVLSLCQAAAPLTFHSHFPAFIIVEIGSAVIMHNVSNEGTEFFQARSADSGCGPRVESV